MSATKRQWDEQEQGTDRPTTALARVEDYRGLEMAITPAEAQARLQQLQAFVKSTMKEGEDYGIIPGTEKPTLLKPGAEKLAEIYGFAHRYETIDAVKDWSSGFFYFEYRCVISSRRNSAFVGEGIGSCNSRESKYAGRWVPASELPPGMNTDTLQKRTGARWAFANELPKGTDQRSLKSRERMSKNGKPYKQFQVIDEQFLMPNPDPYSLVNTIQKMAAKRAYVMAVIAATRSSGTFTQDVEDLPAEAYGRTDAERDEEPEAAEPTETRAYVSARDIVEEADNVDALKAAWAAAKKSRHLTPEQLRDLSERITRRRRELAAKSEPPSPREPGDDSDVVEGVEP